MYSGVHVLQYTYYSTCRNYSSSAWVRAGGLGNTAAPPPLPLTEGVTRRPLDGMRVLSLVLSLLLCSGAVALQPLASSAYTLGCGRRLPTMRALGGLSLDRGPPPSFSVGDAVRVKASIKVMHVPGHKGGLDPMGSVGTVLRAYSEPNLSANRPIKVQFGDPVKWVGHFDAFELERAEG